jgi:hypothetical protein
MPIERDAASIEDAGSPDLRHHATDDATSDVCSMKSAFHIQLHDCARKQAVLRFKQRAHRRRVDDGGDVTGANPNFLNAMIDRIGRPAALPPVLFHAMGHSGFHCRDRTSNFRIRVLPVSP